VKKRKKKKKDPPITVGQVDCAHNFPQHLETVEIFSISNPPYINARFKDAESASPYDTPFMNRRVE